MHNLRNQCLAVVAGFVLPAILGACAMFQGGDPVTTDAAAPAEWQTPAAVGAVSMGWLDAFGDATLTSLVVEAQANNRDLQAAAGGVDQAWALARQAGAALLPGVNATAGVTETGASEGGSTTGLQAGLQVSWEVDLWGRIHAGRSAATASAQAAEADYRHAQQSVAAAVARAYFLGVEARLQQAAAADIVTALTQTIDIVTAQYREGLASAQDLALARSDLAAARERLAAVEGGGRDAIRALELLVGRYPAADLEVPDTMPSPPPLPPAGLPAGLLERRPDLIAAERRVAAATDSLHEARVARLPAVSLTATGGGASNALADLLNPANLAWQATSQLLAPLFDGGARQARVEAAAATRDQAVAAYAQAALTAFAEVEETLDHGAVLAVREASLTTALREAEEALRLAELRLREGEIALLDVLTVRQRVIGARTNLLALQRERLTQYVNLNLALGGDWQAAGRPEPS